MNARDRILAKLRAAAPLTLPPGPKLAGHYGVRAMPAPAERIAEFSAQLRASHAEVVLAGAADWPRLLADVIAAKSVRRLLADWQGAQAQALRQALSGSIDFVAFDRPIEQWKEELFDTVDAGFSVADAAVAATGTLIFASGACAPRTLSLVPPLHLALVRAESIYADLYSATAGERWSEAMPTNLIMVSGPSKTADIQQTLAYGAHGPKELVVVVVLPVEARP